MTWTASCRCWAFAWTNRQRVSLFYGMAHLTPKHDRFKGLGFALMWSFSLLGVLLGGSGCQDERPYDALGEHALAAATALVEAHPQREAGVHSQAVAEWLAARLGEGATLQPFETPLGTMVNVIKMTPNPVAILVSHTDTKVGIEGFVGANDGASTTGLLLTLAQETDLPVVYLFVDGEECRTRYTATDGLHGSWYFAKTRQDLKHLPVIVLDMLGDKDFNPGLAENATYALNRTLATAARKAGVPLLNAGEIVDDHVPFLVEGWQATDVIDFDYGPNHQWWHTAEDTLDKLSAQSLAQTAKLICKTVELLKKDRQ